MDDIDLAIVRELQVNGRLTLSALGHRVGLSGAPVQRRLKRLEDDGWIDRYVAIVDPVRASRDFVVFINVEFDPEPALLRSEIEAELISIPEVAECHRMTGRSQYLLKIITRDRRTFDSVNERITGLAGFRRASRDLSLETLKDTTELPLPVRLNDL